MSHVLDARASALPRSLAFSSLSYLTAVVLALALRAALPASAVRIVDTGPVIDPWVSHDPTVVTPVDPGAIPPLAPPTTADGRIVPVDELPPSTPVQDFALAHDIVDPGAAVGHDSGLVRASGNLTGTATPETIPPPKTFEYIEVLPQLVRRVTPAYPDIARQAGMDGSVELWLRVGKDGRVIAVQVEQSDALFDSAAVEAARRFVFTPATTDGHPVAAWVSQKFHFSLRD